MQQRRIGPFQVSASRLGCMSLSHAYGQPPPAEQGERLLLAALGAGVTLFDVAQGPCRASRTPVTGDRYSEQSNREVDTEVF